MIKKKALLLTALVLTFTMTLTACSFDKITDLIGSKDDSSASDTSADEEQDEADVDDDTDVDVDDDNDIDVDDDNDIDDDDDDKAPAGNSNPSALSDGKFVNLDNMQFAVNGTVYTLGQTTLQTLIDDGVPFDEDDIANANNNLNGNSGSQGFRIELAEYWTAQVYVLNPTDDNKTIAECAISEIYLPVKQDETQNILELSFPLNLTQEDLLAQAGEPTDTSEYVDGDYKSVDVEFTKESTVYYGDWGYSFEFINDELRYVTIDYLP